MLRKNSRVYNVLLKWCPRDIVKLPAFVSHHPYGGQNTIFPEGFVSIEVSENDQMMMEDESVMPGNKRRVAPGLFSNRIRNVWDGIQPRRSSIYPFYVPLKQQRLIDVHLQAQMIRNEKNAQR